MSKVSEEYLKIIREIGEHISNEEERKYVLDKVSELSSLYIDLIDRATEINDKKINAIEEKQRELDEKLAKVNGYVDLIKKDIYEDEDYDFEIVCPYCNHEFVASVEDELKEEIECPKCHNIIELDWDGEEEEEGCSGHCCSCGFHDDCESEDDEENDEDDDM